MDKSNIVSLIHTSYVEDDIGNHIPIEKKRTVFCNVSSVNATEWIDAGRIGINPRYRLTVFAHDYKGEEIAEFDGVRYGIYRTYIGKNESLELYLEKKAGV